MYSDHFNNIYQRKLWSSVTKRFLTKTYILLLVKFDCTQRQNLDSRCRSGNQWRDYNVYLVQSTHFSTVILSFTQKITILETTLKIYSLKSAICVLHGSLSPILLGCVLLESSTVCERKRQRQEEIMHSIQQLCDVFLLEIMNIPLNNPTTILLLLSYPTIGF